MSRFPRMKLQELLNEGSHIHVAACNRRKLIRLGRIARDHYGLAVREFPPFDTVDNVHTNGSFHYRQAGQCHVARNYSNRGNGLAFDASGGRQVEFYADCARKYGTPS